MVGFKSRVSSLEDKRCSCKKCECRKLKTPQSTIRLLIGRLVILLYSGVSTINSNTQNANIEATTEKV